MNRTVLVRYGEIALKSEPVRKKFKKTLIGNMKSILRNVPFKIESERGRIFINTPAPEKVSFIVANLPGVVSTSPAWKTKASMKKIFSLVEKVAKKTLPKKGSFAIRSRRAGDYEFTSKEIAEKVGKKVLEDYPEMKVDLDSPDHELHIEVRDDRAYVFTEIFDGPGGLPVGTQGKALSLFSGKITNAISMYLMMKRGMTVYPLFFSTDRKREEYKKSAINLAKEMLKYQPNIEFRIVNFQPFLDEITDKIPKKMRQVVCKRTELDLAENIGETIKAKAIISDTSLKEMAIEGLHTIRVLKEKTKLQLLYPNLGLTEHETKKTSDRITDSKPKLENHKVCPYNFVKNRKFNLDEIKKAEESIPEKKMIKSSLNSMEIHKLGG